LTAAPAAAPTFASLSWTERLWQDLQPGPGRLAVALRIVLATVIALVLMMVLQMPFASLGLYYVFLVARESPASSVKGGVMSLLTLALAVAAELFVVIISDNDPMVRLLSVAMAAYLAGTLMVASTLPPLASIWGFIYCTLIALWERPSAPPDALVKASLFLIATVSLAFICTVAVEYVFAYRHAADRLSASIRQRYQLIERVYTLFAQGATGAGVSEAVSQLNRLAATGQKPMLELHAAVVAHGGWRKGEAKRERPGDFPLGSRVYISMLAQLTDTAAAFASRNPNGVDDAQRARCGEIARLCRERPAIEEADHARLASIAGNAGLLDRVESALETILTFPKEPAAESDDEPEPLAADKVPFLIPGAFFGKATVSFALKLTLCVMVCYVFYFAVGWPGISTSVTTIFITALGNTGAIKQKLFNRLIGSAIGGALAIGATVFLFPHMDSITSLVVLVSLVAFISAWCAVGRQFGYAGLQIAFSFYLVAFEGFSAPTDLTPPRDRLVGIMIALLVMWIVFDQLWPVRTVSAMRRTFAAILVGQARFLRIFDGPGTQAAKLKQLDAIRDQIARGFAALRTMNDTVVYEFGRDREQQIRLSENILQSALTSVPIFWNQLAVLRREDGADFIAEPHLIEMRLQAAALLDRMANAVSQNSAFARDEAATRVDGSIMSNARYREYAQNTAAGLDELQARVAELQS
jgi:multidrug resistance protein MdtO